MEVTLSSTNSGKGSNILARLHDRLLLTRIEQRRSRDATYALPMEKYKAVKPGVGCERGLHRLLVYDIQRLLQIGDISFQVRDRTLKRRRDDHMQLTQTWGRSFGSRVTVSLERVGSVLEVLLS